MDAPERKQRYSSAMKTARHWHLRADGLIECDLCPHHCRIADKKHGTCLVRQRTGKELVAASYGLICGLAVDPIEKKPLNHFKLLKISAPKRTPFSIRDRPLEALVKRISPAAVRSVLCI